jgi:hypothetical protein
MRLKLTAYADSRTRAHSNLLHVVGDERQMVDALKLNLRRESCVWVTHCAFVLPQPTTSFHRSTPNDR